MQNTKHKAGRVAVCTLKVYQKIIFRHSGLYSQNPSVYLPEIRLMGKWLAKCGFAPGQQIQVTQETNKLTITRVLADMGN